MTIRTALAAVLSVGLLAPAAVYAQGTSTPRRNEGINAREHHQVTRIKDGVEDKELTKGELDRLHADEAAVRAEERVFRNSGDGLNKAERKDLEKDLDKTSHEIYRAKHNDRTRGGR
jgi:hypothetical protein